MHWIIALLYPDSMRACLSAILFLLPAAAQPRYVDCHIHWNESPGFLEKLVASYRKQSAIACLSGRRQHFEAVRDAAKKYSDVVVPYLWIDLDDADVLDQVDLAHTSGFKGLKIHSPMKDYDDASYFPVYARAERYRLVTQLHTGISFRPADKIPRLKGSAARMRPIFLDTIARAFPELNLVGSHLGNPWYDEAAETARWNPNVWFDLTGSSLIKKSDELAVFRKYLWWGTTAGAAHMPTNTPHAFEKIVFGTDNDPLDVCIDRYNKLLDACQAPEAVRRKVFAQTMIQLLGWK